MKCVICGRAFCGYGNNAEPVKDGLCCDECNAYHVIPARIFNALCRQCDENEKGVEKNA